MSEKSDVQVTFSAHQVTASDVSCEVSEWSKDGGEGICGGTIKISIGDQSVELFAESKADLWAIVRTLATPTIEGWDTSLAEHYTPTNFADQFGRIDTMEADLSGLADYFADCATSFEPENQDWAERCLGYINALRRRIKQMV